MCPEASSAPCSSMHRNPCYWQMDNTGCMVQDYAYTEALTHWHWWQNPPGHSVYAPLCLPPGLHTANSSSATATVLEDFGAVEGHSKCTKSKSRKQRRQRAKQAQQKEPKVVAATSAMKEQRSWLLDHIRTTGASTFVDRVIREFGREALTSILHDAHMLAKDACGYVVIQNLLDSKALDTEQIQTLVQTLQGYVVELALDTWGCRCLQHVLHHASPMQKLHLVAELEQHVPTLAEHHSGNFVLQKCIEEIPADSLGFITEEIKGCVQLIAEHESGCRVIQRLLERFSPTQLDSILGEICSFPLQLSQSKFGNYVVQKVLQLGQPQDQRKIVSDVALNVLEYALNKYSSRVVEQCLSVVHLSASRIHLKHERIMLMQAIFADFSDASFVLSVLVADPYGNYVVQQASTYLEEHERQKLLGFLSAKVTWQMNKYVTAVQKNIVASFVQ